MSEMIRRAADEIPDMRGLLDDADKLILARRVLNAALDPEDEKLVEIVNRALDGVPSGKSAIMALKAAALGETDGS